MKSFMHYTKALCMLGLLSLTVTEASATILLSSAVPGNVTGVAATDLDLNGAAAGGTTMNFIAPIAENVIITFNAECSSGGTNNQWVGLEIFVDPAGPVGPTLVAPTSTLRAFCSGDGTVTNNDGWVSATAQAVARVPAGLHAVRVRVTPGNGAPSWWVSDYSLVISDQ